MYHHLYVYSILVFRKCQCDGLAARISCRGWHWDMASVLSGRGMLDHATVVVAALVSTTPRCVWVSGWHKPMAGSDTNSYANALHELTTKAQRHQGSRNVNSGSLWLALLSYHEATKTRRALLDLSPQCLCG